MDLVILAVLLLPALIAAATLVTARRRWGVRHVAIAGGDGAYRAAEVRVPVPRPVPRSVTVAAIAAWTWGAVTLLLFVPAGALLAMITSERGSAGALTAIVVVLVVMSGVAHAFALFVAGTRVARHHEGAAEAAKKTALFAWWHHAAVWVLFTFVTFAHEPASAPITLFLLALPCGLGALVGRSLDAAAKRIDAIDQEDATERHRDLFVPAPT